jgi:predicted dithiol-disulfide oxidoreductase (DUF899 family)
MQGVAVGWVPYLFHLGVARVKECFELHDRRILYLFLFGSRFTLKTKETGRAESCSLYLSIINTHAAHVKASSPIMHM